MHRQCPMKSGGNFHSLHAEQREVWRTPQELAWTETRPLSLIWSCGRESNTCLTERGQSSALTRGHHQLPVHAVYTVTVSDTRWHQHWSQIRYLSGPTMLKSGCRQKVWRLVEAGGAVLMFLVLNWWWVHEGQLAEFDLLHLVLRGDDWACWVPATD